MVVSLELEGIVLNQGSEFAPIRSACRARHRAVRSGEENDPQNSSVADGHLASSYWMGRGRERGFCSRESALESTIHRAEEKGAQIIVLRA